MRQRWFRFYDEVVDDPKVQTLPPALFKAWVNILCIASRNDGFLPSVSKIAFSLRCDETAVERLLERLLNEGLIDRKNGGVNGYRYAPHGWTTRQYKSDTSTERVKRFRQRRGETAPDTETDKTIAKAMGGEPPKPMDLKAMVFASGRQILMESGIEQRSTGSIIGRWRKTYSDAAVLDVLARCQSEQPSAPLEWISAALSRGHGKNTGSDPMVIDRERTPEELAAARQRLIERGEIHA